MPRSISSAEEIVRRGEELYERNLRAAVEPLHNGKSLVLDIETGEYEIDSNELAALQRAKAKRPDGPRFIKRVGFAAAHRIGGPLKADRRICT